MYLTNMLDVIYAAEESDQSISHGLEHHKTFEYDFCTCKVKPVLCDLPREYSNMVT